MSYKTEAHASRSEKLRHTLHAAHGGSVSRGEVKRLADASVERHRKLAWHLGPEEIAKDVKKDVRKDKFARGGRTKDKKRDGDVNIIIESAPQRPPMPMPPIGAPGPIIPARPVAPPPMPPPGAGAGPGGPPGGGPMGPGLPPGLPMRARGGGVKMEAGAGSGEGRLEKTRKARKVLG